MFSRQVFFLVFGTLQVCHAAYEWPEKALVELSNHQIIECQKAPQKSCEFYSCTLGKYLHFPRPMSGLSPTVHSEALDSVQIPLQVINLSNNKNIFKNDSGYQYVNRDPRKEFYRQHNLMLSFEPALRFCTDPSIKSFHHSYWQRVQPASPETPWTLEVPIGQNFHQIASLGGMIAKDLLHQKMTQWRLDPKLRFDNLNDGCYSRAEVISQDLKRMGFSVAKIWVEGFALWPVGFARQGTFFSWRYHVAAVVKMKNPDGTFQLSVVDPGVSPKPLSVQKWLFSIKGPNNRINYVSRFDEKNATLQDTVEITLTSPRTYQFSPSRPESPSNLSEEQQRDEALETLKDLP